MAMKTRDAAVLITGGSRGLGRALGGVLAKRGARVVLVAREANALHEAVEALRKEGGEVHGIVADVGEKADTYKLAGQAAALIGPIDVVVHNASTLGPVPLQHLLDTDCEDLERTLQVNLVGPFRLTKALAGAMAVRGAGAVVHISSDAAVEAYPGWGVYGVSKAALDHLTRSLAVELRDTQVRVVSVDPGEMDTEMHAAAVPDADRAALERPGVVAERLAVLLEHLDEVDTGARVVLSRWRPR
jgi:NAD(P)-dependent dehydrogenase (short-subunit alcohol dehydrogenase family)